MICAFALSICLELRGRVALVHLGEAAVVVTRAWVRRPARLAGRGDPVLCADPRLLLVEEDVVAQRIGIEPWLVRREAVCAHSDVDSLGSGLLEDAAGARLLVRGQILLSCGSPSAAARHPLALPTAWEAEPAARPFASRAEVSGPERPESIARCLPRRRGIRSSPLRGMDQMVLINSTPELQVSNHPRVPLAA